MTTRYPDNKNVPGSTLTEAERDYLMERLAADLIVMVMEEFHFTLPQALDAVYTSETLRLVLDPATGLYYQGSVYVYSYLQDEIRYGTPFPKK